MTVVSELVQGSAQRGIAADGELPMQDWRDCGIESLVDKAERGQLLATTNLESNEVSEPTLGRLSRMEGENTHLLGQATQEFGQAGKSSGWS